MATTKTYQINIDVESKTLGQLEDQLANVNDELKQVDRNSEAFKNLSKQAQVLNAEIEKTNNQIEGLKLEDKLQAADGAAKIFGGSLASVVGTLGVLGVESEVFGRFEEKAASAIAVGMGIKDVSEGFGQFSEVMKKSGIAAKLFGSTTSKALIATGVGAFVVLLGTVIAYWDDITGAVKRFAASNAFVQKAIDGIKGAFDSLFEAARPVLEFLGILPDEAERAQIAITEAANERVTQLEREITVMQAAGASAKMLYDLRKELLDEELKALKASGAEKEEIYKKETEILALEAAERKRIRDEEQKQLDEQGDPNFVREKIATVNAIKVEGLQELQTKEIEVLSAAQINKDLINQRELESRERLIQSDLILQAKLDAARQSSLDNVIAIAGAESKVGKAALIAKQVLLAQELVQEASKTIAFSSQAVARSTIAVAEGTAQTAKVGFPQNIPLLIGYAAQAAGIIMAIRSAVKSAKGVGAPNISQPSVPTSGPRASQSPQQMGQFDVPQTFANTGPTIKAYVLSGDARSAQEADAKIEKRRTID